MKKKPEEKKEKVKVRVRAARIGGCLRALSFHIMKVPETEITDKTKLKIFKDGEDIEEQVIQELEEDGYDVERIRYKKIIEINGYKVKITGTPDSTVRMKKGNYPVEIKSMNSWRFSKVPENFKDWQDKLKDKYASQMSIYCWLSDSPFIFWVIKEKVKGDKKGELKIIKVKVDDLPDPEDLIESRLKKALRVLDGEDILPDGFADCKFCNYDNSDRWWESVCAKTFFNPSQKEITKRDKKLIKKVREMKKDARELMLLADAKNGRCARYDVLLLKKYGKEVTNI